MTRPLILVLLLVSSGLCAQKIDRKALVQRHNVQVHHADTLASLTVGNGRFAFTVDATGLQSFPQSYANGIPLGTQSEWGWHSFPNTNGYTESESLRAYQLNGRAVKYMVQINQPARNKEASNYFRQNLHRLQLGNLGLEIKKRDGALATLSDITDIDQVLDLYTGIIHSQFKVEGVPVEVFTAGHGERDAVAVRVISPLLKERRLLVRLRIPSPTGAWADAGDVFNEDLTYTSSMVKAANGALITRTMDTTRYEVRLNWSKANIAEKGRHYFIVTPDTALARFELSCEFVARGRHPAPLLRHPEQREGSPRSNQAQSAYFAIAENSKQSWQNFWNSGGAIDFAGSTDPRAHELERRIILSQYLTRVQCAGSQPPQETGLTYNSWFGKPHLEMHWWHGIHFALWNRMDLLERSMSWYQKVAPTAFGIAQRQGYNGARWQKMTDPDGREVPSSVGAFLVWQQPHFIYFAELAYQHNKAALNKYAALVEATAAFMASYPVYDTANDRYILGKGLIPAQERFKAEETFNPSYELVYWKWALEVAQQWRQRSAKTRSKDWDHVIAKLSKLPVMDNRYLATESATDSYTNPEYRTDHPSVLGALGMVPKDPMVDTTIMGNTLNWIWQNWTWPDTWGWDFPMVAMTATRLGRPEQAMDALLMNIKTNTYLPNGHNYQDDRLRLYLPGNGGLLAAVALMCAGYEGSGDLPGIPKTGWKVKHEGLKKSF